MKEFLQVLISQFQGLPPEFWQHAASLTGSLTYTLTPVGKPKSAVNWLGMMAIGYFSGVYLHTILLGITWLKLNENGSRFLTAALGNVAIRWPLAWLFKRSKDPDKMPPGMN